MKAIILDYYDGKVVTFQFPAEVAEEDAQEYLESIPWYHAEACHFMLVHGNECGVEELTAYEDGSVSMTLKTTI